MTQPRAMIPEKWALNGHCPLCNHTPLHHCPTLAADQIACPSCGVAFEIEDGGPQVRLMTLPPVVGGAPDLVWRTPKEARAWVRNLPRVPPPTGPASAAARTESPPIVAPASQPAPAPVPESSPPASSPPPPEALAKAHKLYELGQTPAQIQAVLERGEEWTREQIQAVMETLLLWDAQRKAKQRRALIFAFSAIFALTLVFVVLIVLLMPATGAAAPGEPRPAECCAAGGASNSGGGSAGQPVATAGPAGSLLDQFVRWATSGGSQPSGSASPANGAGQGGNGEVPSAFQTLVPPGVTVLQAPDPQVFRGSGPPASACPTTKDAAAQLFGGQADQWQAAENVRGWMLFSTSGPVTVHVPANMSLGVLQFGDSLSMTDIPGPALVTDVYLGAISCE
jgi:hypothetical protein